MGDSSCRSEQLLPQNYLYEKRLNRQERFSMAALPLALLGWEPSSSQEPCCFRKRGAWWVFPGVGVRLANKPRASGTLLLRFPTHSL